MQGWKLYCALGIVALSVTAIVPAANTGDVLSAPTDTGNGPSAPSVGLFSTASGSGLQAEEKKPEAVEPLFVRPLVEIESGRNDSNPVWSPQGTFIAFERSVGDKKELRVTLSDGTPVQTIFHLLSQGPSEMKFFFPGVSNETSYNADITWSPDELRFVFMSNGGEGNYDIYLLDLGGSAPVRLTEHKEKDGQAQWSPVEDSVVFVSGRTGNGDIYLLFDVHFDCLFRDEEFFGNVAVSVTTSYLLEDFRTAVPARRPAVGCCSPPQSESCRPRAASM